MYHHRAYWWNIILAPTEETSGSVDRSQTFPCVIFQHSFVNVHRWHSRCFWHLHLHFSIHATGYWTYSIKSWIVVVAILLRFYYWFNAGPGTSTQIPYRSCNGSRVVSCGHWFWFARANRW